MQCLRVTQMKIICTINPKFCLLCIHMSIICCMIFPLGKETYRQITYKLNWKSVSSAFSRKQIRHPRYAPSQNVQWDASRRLVLVRHVLLLLCLWIPKLRCASSSLSLKHVATVLNHPHLLIAQLALVELATFTETYKSKQDQYDLTLHVVRLSCLPSYLWFIFPFVK